MESKSFIQTLHQKNWRFANATTLEDILCLATFMAQGYLYTACDVDEARAKWLEAFEGDCYSCPLCKTCLACIINE